MARYIQPNPNMLMPGKQAEPNGRCWCGCGAETKPGRFFVATHDGRAYRALRQRFVGKLGNDGLANMLASLGFDNIVNGVCRDEPDNTPA